jgi:polynucleotide 5'-kinase involved in rRNA processing
VLVDTTGMVRGEEASLLKFHKISFLQPRHLLILQERNELEPLVRPFGDSKSIKTYRLPVSSAARVRSPLERKTYREAKFQDYFKRGSVRLLPTEGVTFLGQASSDPSGRGGGLSRYQLAGLNDADHRTLALGIVEVFDRQSQELFIYTPLGDFTPVRSLTIGSIHIDLNGREREQG